MLKEARLVRTLVELADSLVEDFDAVDVLTLLSHRCVAALDVTAAGVMLGAKNGQLEVIASSSAAMRSLELFEIQSNEGPCLDCYRSGRPIVNLRLSAADGRWPTFTARALAEGFASVHSLPMHLRGHTIGALNMFRTHTGALDETDVLAAQGFADVATIAIVQHRVVTDAHILHDQLDQALRNRMFIEQAKGMVAQSAGLTLDQAFIRLRSHARKHNLRLSHLCQSIAEGALDPGSLDRPRHPVRH